MNPEIFAKSQQGRTPGDPAAYVLSIHGKIDFSEGTVSLDTAERIPDSTPASKSKRWLEAFRDAARCVDVSVRPAYDVLPAAITVTVREPNQPQRITGVFDLSHDPAKALEARVRATSNALQQVVQLGQGDAGRALNMP